MAEYVASFGRVRSIDNKAKRVRVVASTSSIARDGFSIRTDGWQLDSYRKSPSVLWAHQDMEPPIAKAVVTEIVGDELQQVHEFSPEDSRSMDFFRRIERGELTSVSVRWLPIEQGFERINGKEVLVFRKQELLEVSWVNIPSLTEALVVRGDNPAVALTRADFRGNGNGTATLIPAPRPMAGATDRVRSSYERRWTTPSMPLTERSVNMRANMELAGILLAGLHAARTRTEGRQWHPDAASPEFLAAWRSIVFDGAPQVQEGSHTRAMDTAESGFGLQLVGTAFESALWDAARNRDTLLRMVATDIVPKGTTSVALGTTLPPMLFVPEHLESTDPQYATTKMGTSAKTGAGSKFSIQAVASSELVEDAAIAFVPALRGALNESFRLHLASAWYNGDTATAGNTNINLIDSTPAATAHYLALDGIRKLCLSTATGQSRDAAGPLSADLIDDARAKIGLATDSVASLTDADWQGDPSRLLILCDRFTHRELAMLSAYTQGRRATGTDTSGRSGYYDDIPVFSPTFVTRTLASGKLSSVPASNTRGQLTLLATNGWRGLQVGGLTIVAARVQGRDQVQFELYTRQSLLRYADTMAAHIYNLEVS
jgi:hypothetical protein